MIATYAETIDVSAADFEPDFYFIVHVGTAGNVAVEPVGGNRASVTIKAAAGTTIPLFCKKVLNSGTTASDLVVFYGPS